MAFKTVQTGDDWNKQPGTCNQTGNSAPRFPWAKTALGRFARTAALCCAYKLGHDDDMMGKNRQFPPMRETFRLFCKLLPWFPRFFDAVQKLSATRKGYPLQLLQPFNSDDVHGRVHYCFAKPGSKRHSPHPRLYGISVEHPSSTYQRRKGGRGEVFARCSMEIMRRLEAHLSFTISEAKEMGK